MLLPVQESGGAESILRKEADGGLRGENESGTEAGSKNAAPRAGVRKHPPASPKVQPNALRSERTIRSERTLRQIRV